MIGFTNVSKSFGANVVLSDISTRFPLGKVTCLIGPSGSGKSTLLRCINGLERHDAGQIVVDGAPVTDRTLPDVRRKVAMVFQRFNLLPHRTAIENVIEGPIHALGEKRDEAIERGMALLERVGMADRADAYPSHLSGGQQQRIGIARALAMRPRAVLFDEPTSALDPERVGEVLRVMRDLADEGLTMIVVTHEIGFAREVGDRAVFMADGVIVEEGEARRVLTDPQVERTRLFLDRVINPL